MRSVVFSQKFLRPVVTPLLLACLTLNGATAAPQRSLAEFEQRIVPVAAWGGTTANPSGAREHTIVGITLHHEGETFKRERETQQYLRSLQSWSRSSKKWIDIPYHYVVDVDGRTFNARDIHFAGDTNTTYNPAGQALIEAVGNFEAMEPSQQQLDAVVDMMALLVMRHGVSIDTIRGHKDHAHTACPGKNLYYYLENGYFRQKVALRLAGMQAQKAGVSPVPTE